MEAHRLYPLATGFTIPGTSCAAFQRAHLLPATDKSNLFVSGCSFPISLFIFIPPPAAASLDPQGFWGTVLERRSSPEATVRAHVGPPCEMLVAGKSGVGKIPRTA